MATRLGMDMARADTNRKINMLFIAFIAMWLMACSDQAHKGREKFFLDLGQFSVESLGRNVTLVKDGAGRKFVLAPKGTFIPNDLAGIPIIQVPVRRVVAFRFFDVCCLKALGALDTLVGVTIPEEDWHLSEIKKGLKNGRIAYLGRPDSIDFEILKKQAPDLVLTWNLAIIPMLDELGIPAVVTTTPMAMCLSTRMKFVEFMAPFFQRQEEAQEFFMRVKESLDSIRAKTHLSNARPKVMWGDIYEKRVLVEPGNSWIAQLVAIVNSDYLFKDVYGASCIEINLERFLYSGKDADIYFTYRTPASGATSKDALRQMNPLIRDIRPLTHEGRVYCPRPEFIQEQDRLDEIFTEIAAILHPELYPGYRLKFFIELPEHDPLPSPQGTEGGSK